MSAYIEVPAAVNLEFYLFKWPVHESITKFNQYIRATHEIWLEKLYMNEMKAYI